MTVQTISLDNNALFPFCEALLDAPTHLGLGIPVIQLFQHIVIHTKHVHQGEGPAISFPLQAVR